MRARHAHSSPRQPRRTGRLALRALGCGLALSLSVAGGLGCDSKDGDKSGDKSGDKAEGKEAKKGPSEQAQKALKEVEEIKAELAKGEDVKYACAGNLAMYEDLQKSSDEADKKAYGDLVNVCFVDAPKKIIADLRAKMEKGEELETMATVTLETTLEDDAFPKDGEPAKVAADAKKLLEVEIPTHKLNAELEVAKKEKEEGKTVSMGCIKAKQIVDESAKALEGDEKGKAALEAFKAACPEK